MNPELIIPILGILAGIIITLSVFIWQYHDEKGKREAIVEIAKHLNNPSKLAELQELEHWKARFEAADAASAGYFSRRWVASNILDVSEKEFERMQSEMFYDKKHDFMLEQVGETAAAETGGGGAVGGGARGRRPTALPSEDVVPLLDVDVARLSVRVQWVMVSSPKKL